MTLAAAVHSDVLGAASAVLLPTSAISAIVCSWLARRRVDLKAWVVAGFVVGTIVVTAIALLAFLVWSFLTTWTF
jgi:hypothetical protein